VRFAKPSEPSGMPLCKLIMAAVCNRAGHYIFALWFLLSIYLSFLFPRLISAVADWMYCGWPKVRHNVDCSGS